jgi:hypothetical protein
VSYIVVCVHPCSVLKAEAKTYVQKGFRKHLLCVVVAKVFSSSPLLLSWKHDLIGPKLTAWNVLLPRIANMRLTQEQDVFRWNLDPNGQFSVKSHYSALIHQDVPSLNKIIWKTKTPLKINIFMWYLRRGVILTKDNLVQRNWQGNEKCCFCHKNETIKHLFLECRFARVVWSCIQVALNLPQPRNISHLLGSWLRGF